MIRASTWLNLAFVSGDAWMAGTSPAMGGGGGALWLLNEAMKEIVLSQKDLKNSPVFYMWLLSKSVPKH